mmetsp:Transcript_49880/g.143581  ORF Transcript_49880/g.143581 Transcript_49880/m.143581 type:complete len:200 (-) Transcript_49880:278-877(-)
MVHGGHGLQPTVVPLPCEDLPEHGKLPDTFPQLVGRRRLPHPTVVAFRAFGRLSLAFALRLLGPGRELGIGLDLLERDGRCRLLRFLLGAANLSGPAPLGPIAGQRCEPHRGLEAASDADCLVDSLTLVKIALRYLHAQGVQFRLRRDRRVLTLLRLPRPPLRELLGGPRLRLPLALFLLDLRQRLDRRPVGQERLMRR